MPVCVYLMSAHYEELIIRYSSQCPEVTTVKFITRKPLSAETITDLSTDLKKYSYKQILPSTVKNQTINRKSIVNTHLLSSGSSNT